MRRRIRRTLVGTHRWLGIALGLFVAIWFVSGVVMMYHRMPELDDIERLRRAPPLDLERAHVDPLVAIHGAEVEVDSLRVVSVAGRPAYDVRGPAGRLTLMADTGEPFGGFAPNDAVAVARDFLLSAESLVGEVEWMDVLREPDQWTLQARALLPMHRIAVDDGRGTVVYVSDRSGRVELTTDSRARLWGMVGAVPHWLYFRPLRAQSAFWYEVVVWLSVAGLVLTLTGIAWGVVVWLRKRRIGYSGWLYWHQLAGLVFGGVTVTWLFSGLLSMEPWGWSSSTSPSRAEREVMSGGPLHSSLSVLSAAHLRAVLEQARHEIAVKELDVSRFGGRVLVVARGVDGERELFGLTASGESTESLDGVAHDGSVAASAVEPGRLGKREIEDLAVGLSPDSLGAEPGEVDVLWLSEYDSYYRDRTGGLPLPVLRMTFADAERTAFYVDSLTGRILRKETRRSRLNRWLYSGLHSWDFPFLHDRRPLWDLVVIGLSLGGLAVAISSAVPGWRRLRGKLGRLSR